MYGSSFIIWTFIPRASSRQPIELAARPLPKLETTPPVTKMYLVIVFSLSACFSFFSLLHITPFFHLRVRFFRLRFFRFLRFLQCIHSCPEHITPLVSIYF